MPHIFPGSLQRFPRALTGKEGAHHCLSIRTSPRSQPSASIYPPHFEIASSAIGRTLIPKLLQIYASSNSGYRPTALVTATRIVAPFDPWPRVKWGNGRLVPLSSVIRIVSHKLIVHRHGRCKRRNDGKRKRKGKRGNRGCFQERSHPSP